MSPKNVAPAAPEVVVVTGLSGAGRSSSANVLEDLGHFVIDNLPPSLIPKVVELATTAGQINKIALVMDVRSGSFFEEIDEALAELSDAGIAVRILFLEASTETLVRRFEETRRIHPLAPEGQVEPGIVEERRMLERLKERADLIVDTSDLNIHQLQDKIRSAFGGPTPEVGLRTSVVSFGFKYGIPRDADMVLDVRFLPNPHWVPELRPLPGTASEVREYVLGQKGAQEFLERIEGLLAFLLPNFVEEGKSYLTIAVGCTGGHHRSVVLGEEIAAILDRLGFPGTVTHRDLRRGDGG